jgi:ABC-type transport system involved in cytochrome c biogenesis permease component
MAAAGMGAQGHLLLLGAMLVGGSVFAPWAIAAALRIATE